MASNIPGPAAVYHLSFTGPPNGTFNGMGGLVQQSSSLPSSSIFTLNATPPLFPTQNTLIGPALQYHLPFNPASFHYVTNNADSTNFPHHPQNGSGHAGMSINMLGQVYSDVSDSNNSVTLNAGKNGSGHVGNSYPLASGLSLECQTRRLLDDSSARAIGNGGLAKPGISGASGGSKLLNFFAELKCQNNAKKDRPVVVTASPTAVIEDNPDESSGDLEVEDPTVRLQDFKFADHKVLKRPRDLLLHIMKGRTVFETATGQMPTAKHNAYIEAYYDYRQEVTDLDQVLAEPDPPDSDEDPINLDLQRVCQNCHAQKSSSHFNSLTAAHCDNCSRRPTTTGLPNLHPHLPKAAFHTGISPVSVPDKTTGRGGRKKRISPTVEVHTTPATSTECSSIPEKVRKRRNKLVKETIADGSSSSASLIPGLTRPSTGQEVPVDTDHFNLSDVDPEVLHAAPLVLLLRNKPNIQRWKAADVETFLKSVRGMESHVVTFREKKITGKVLWKMCGLDDDLSVNKSIAAHIADQFKEMDMLEGMVFKLRHLLKLATTEEQMDQSEKFLCAL